jgi:hypothetical protein
MGIPGAGLWRILVAGYACNALDRPNDSIRGTPYRVQGIGGIYSGLPWCCTQAGMLEPAEAVLGFHAA